MAERGRPPFEITKKVLETVESYASRGLNQQQIADALGISYGCLAEKKNEYDDFNEAIKRGKAKGIAHVANNLLKNVENGNVTAQIFYLKTQAKWKETDALELTGKDGESIAVDTVHRESAKAATDRFMEKVFTPNPNKEES